MKLYSAQEAYDAWQAGEVAIVDVREQSEHDDQHVVGVPLVPMSELVDRLGDLPTGKPLVILCRSGNRSGKVAEYLNGTGDFGDVANLEGGFLSWAASGLPYEGTPPV